MFLEIENNFIQRNHRDKSKTNGIFRSYSPSQCTDKYQREPRTNTTGKSDSMARTNRNSYELPSAKSKSFSRSRAALSRTIWSRCVDVRSKHHVSPSRRSNKALCTSKVSLQFDGFKLVAGPHYNFRFCSKIQKCCGKLTKLNL